MVESEKIREKPPPPKLAHCDGEQWGRLSSLPVHGTFLSRVENGRQECRPNRQTRMSALQPGSWKKCRAPRKS
jgi:hypothetical protein